MSKKQNLIIRLEAKNGKKKGWGWAVVWRARCSVGALSAVTPREKGEVQRNRSIPTLRKFII